MGSHVAVPVQGLLSPQVLQGEEQTAVPWGPSEGYGLGEGSCVSPARGDPSAGEKRFLSSCFRREVSVSLSS